MFCVFVGCLPGITGYHRVSPGITGYHRVSLDPVGFPPVPGACGAPILAVAAGGGGPQLAVPPGPRFHTETLSNLTV